MLPGITGFESPMQAERIFLRISEAAEIAGIGRSKAYELVAKGEWPSVHIGRSARVPAEGLQEWARRKVEESRVESFETPAQ